MNLEKLLRMAGQIYGENQREQKSVFGRRKATPAEIKRWLGQQQEEEASFEEMIDDCPLPENDIEKT